jgi:hypothetical protein|tara:strand:- start:2076 stop:2411 length:336 start_codon:yes stop_codon:yes gene_type:complete
MIKKKITVSINSTYKYLQIWNGIFGLTNKELSILASFIDVQITKEDVNLCSVSVKKAVASIIGIKDPNTLNNYIKKYKDKGVTFKRDGMYILNPMLNPATEVVEITINRDV